MWKKWDEEAAAQRWGVPFDGVLLSRVCWADDNILIAQGPPAQLRRMLRRMDALLPEAGMSADWADSDKCSWTGTHTGGAVIEVGGHEVPCVPNARVPGRIFNANSFEESTVQDRVAKAWRAFWVNEDTIRMKSASYKSRLRFLETIVRPTLFWGITATDPTAGLLETVRKLHRSMMRQALRLFKRPGRSWDEHCALCRSKINATLETCKMEGWELSLLRHHWRLMGHPARMPQGSVNFAGLTTGGLAQRDPARSQRSRRALAARTAEAPHERHRQVLVLKADVVDPRGRGPGCLAGARRHLC